MPSNRPFKTDAVAFAHFLLLYIPASLVAIVLIGRLLALLLDLPLWASTVAILTVFLIIIYFSTSYIPKELDWNPSFRQLYPHRQYTVERAVVRILRRARLFPQRDPPRIPPEIWAIILKYASPTPMEFRTTCSPEDYQEFVDALLHDNIFRAPSNLDRQAPVLKRVCKMWNAIICANTKSFIRIYNKDLTDLPWDFYRANIELTDSQYYLDKNPIILQPTCQTVTHQLSILLLKFAREYRRSGSDHVLFTNSASVLLQHKDHLHSVSTLALEGRDLDPPRAFLKDIRRSFSGITTLAIVFHSLEGGLVLEKLENLYFDVKKWDHNRWWFPALRQLAFGDRCKNLTWFSYWVPCPADFWRKHPFLKYLVVPYKSFLVTHPPPPDHPLTYLHLQTDQRGFFQYEFGRLDPVLKAIPNLERVRIPVNRWDWTKLCTGFDLLQVYQARGIQWVGKGGEELEWPKSQNGFPELRDWENHMTLIIFGALVFIWWICFIYGLDSDKIAPIWPSLFFLPLAWIFIARDYYLKRHSVEETILQNV